ncbi:MAG: hypothetical protein AB8B78_07695 [Polaribacter sp.]
MKKFIKKVVFYIISILIIGNVIAFTANYFFKKSQFYKSSFLINALNTKDTLDYFVVGSSRGLTTLNTKQIDKKLNLKGVNLSMDDTDLKTHFLMIKHFFNSGYKTNFIILTLDESSFFSTPLNLGNNDYRFSPFINRKYVKNHFTAYENSKLNVLSNSDINPFFSYSYYNFELLLPAVLSAFKPNYRNKFDDKGNYSYPNSGVRFLYEENTLQKIKIKNPLIEEIKQYLDKNNCDFIMYISPLYNKKYSFQSSLNYKIINHTSILNDDLNYFYDYTHVNFEGRTVSTNFFTDDFKKQLDSISYDK